MGGGISTMDGPDWLKEKKNEYAIIVRIIVGIMGCLWEE